MVRFGLLRRRPSEQSPSCEQQPQPSPTPPSSSLLPSPQHPHPNLCLRDTAPTQEKVIKWLYPHMQHRAASEPTSCSLPPALVFQPHFMETRNPALKQPVSRLCCHSFCNTLHPAQLLETQQLSEGIGHTGTPYASCVPWFKECVIQE